MTIYPTLADILTLHSWVIDAFGGSPGVRDQAALESALLRPQSGYCEDVIAEAAVLLESLPQNHRFVDGNKRVAITAPSPS